MRRRFAVLVLKNTGLAVLPFWIVFVLTKILSDGPVYDHQHYHLTIAGLVFLLPLLWGAVFGSFLDENFQENRSTKCYNYHAYWYYFLNSNLFYFIHWAFRESGDYKMTVGQMYSTVDVVSLLPNVYYVFAIVCQALVFVLTLRGARKSLAGAFDAN